MKLFLRYYEGEKFPLYVYTKDQEGMFINRAELPFCEYTVLFFGLNSSEVKTLREKEYVEVEMERK